MNAFTTVESVVMQNNTKQEKHVLRRMRVNSMAQPIFVFFCQSQYFTRPKDSIVGIKYAQNFQYCEE